ncbi:hypothetical protein Q4Q34_19415 [Flavivirga abyssicola]|uniref:hypothetical protein n=1 Tax=Flavivirga abyssicola TaxID=3063533 RepID=UPI0026E07720|nr:hypothetical protein [Flavivirga sp. MEBiC07777]WVK13386.1 hypothetical protein Q4Q34_19415 [Flavivirga sp. MEBiC07777]
MNNFRISVVAVFLVCLTGCSSSEQKLNNPTDDNAIFGKWKLVEQYMSVGGPQFKVDVENGAEYSFLNNGIFVSDHLLDCTEGKFEFESDTLNLMYNCDKFKKYEKGISYRASLESDVLTLTPITIICMDGCSYIFKKITN